MKKLLSILLTMLMLISVICIAPVSAAEVETAQTGAPETLYLNAGVWDQADALIRGWVWGASGASDKWIYFTDADGDGTFEAALDAAYTDIIFFRGAPGSTEWSNEWNRQQTKIPTDGKNLYTITDWSAGSWGTYVAPTPVQPGDASAYYLMGTLTDWTTGQNMVYAEDTAVVTTTLELAAGDYELKVKKDSNWMGVGSLTTSITGGGVLGGTDNVTLAADGGTYTFNFTIASKALDIVYTAPEVVEPTTTTVAETPAEPTTTTVVETPAEPTTTQSAAEPAEAMTVYFSNNKWWTGTINAYIWNADGVLNGNWPGTAMTFVETNDYGEAIYKVVVPAGATNIIFNDGSNQTTDIPVSALYDGVGVYVADADPWFGTYDYVPATPDTTTTTVAATTTTTQTVVEPTTTTVAVTTTTVAETPAEPTTTTQAAAEPVGTVTVYFTNAWAWTDITLYYWNEAGDNVWPGTAMDYVETNDYDQDVYTATIPADATGMIFVGKDNGSDTQSPDITDIKNGYGYYMNWTEELGTHVGSYEYVPTTSDTTTTTVAATTTTTQAVVEPTTTTVAETPAEPTTSTTVAETPAESMTVYFSNNCYWSGTINAYIWDANGVALNGQWPGTAMTYVETNDYDQAIYKVEIPADATYIIFNNASSQTMDIPVSALYDGIGVYVDGDSYGTYDYVVTPDDPATTTTVAATTVTVTETPEVPADPQTVYFVDYPDNFTEVYAYAWSTEVNENSATGDEIVTDVAAEWPGVKMTATGESLSENAAQAGGLVYSVTFDKAYDYIIFSGTDAEGASLGQTEDLTFVADMYCYWGTEMWYDSIAAIEEAHPYEEEPDEPAGEYITVYFQNNWLWGDVSIHFWGSEYVTDTEWPGAAMDLYDNDGTYDVYSYVIPADITGIVITGTKDDGSGTLDQTPNIEEGFYDGICYYMTWDNGNAVGSIDITELFPNMGGEEGGDSETAPSYSGATVTLGGTLGLNLYFDINDTVMADQTAKVVFTVKGETIEVPVSELEYTDYGYCYTINLAAKEMTEVVTAQILATDFESEVYTTSIKEYAEAMLRNYGEYRAEQNIVKAMLNYGAASQVYFGYNTDNLANDSEWMTAEDKVVTVLDYSDFAPVIEGEGDAIEFYGASLILESDTYLKFYFKVDESKLPEGVTVPSINVNGLPGAILEQNGNLWSITMPSLAAHDLSTEFVLAMGNGHTVTYSAYSYIYTAQQSGKTALVNLANALGAYANAAGVYGGE